MPRSTSPAEIMISNSLPSSDVDHGLAPHSDSRATDSRVTDSYSNSLMDDLFGDVDQILEGNRSDDATFTPRQSDSVITSTARTVQLPADFSPRSAADIYQATMAVQSTQVKEPNGPRSGYPSGGRPVTAHQVKDASTGNLQSSVIQSPIYSSSGHSPGSIGTATIEADPPIQSISNSLYPTKADADFSSKEASPKPQQTIFKPKRQVSLPFLLIGAAAISIVSMLILWTVSAASNRGQSLPSETGASATELPTASDVAFLDYLQSALATISASQVAGNQPVAVLPVAAPAAPPATASSGGSDTGGSLPNLTLPTLPGAIAKAPNIIERVFVPVYQNGQSQNASQNGAAANSTPSKATAALPPIALASANNARRRPTVPVPESAAAALPPSAPATGISSIPVVPAGSRSLPSPGVDLAAGTSAGSTAALNDVTPTSELVLVGVLNLGNRSAALFDIDGSSQRAYVGDRIGLSNWTLVSVNGQDVVIRRNDEVRSVYIGQRF